MRIRIALALAAVGLSALAAYAQPSDAQIIKDLTNPGVFRVELSPGPTKKDWNSTYAQYMWVRGAIVWRNANVPEYPKAEVKITGTARYHYGASTSFREMKVSDNEYFGLPAPTKEEMIGMIRERYLAFLGHRANSMVGDLHFLRIPSEEGVIWHTPNSFTIPVEIEYDTKTSYTELTTMYEIVEVRFYRDAVSGPWKENMVAVGRESKAGVVRTYSQEELDAMRTFRGELEEQQASAALRALPTVEVPAFGSDVEVFMHTHRMLREGTREQMQAYLMAMLHPDHFVEGSTTQLNVNGATLVNNVLDRAFNKKSTYAQQYCPDPGVKHQQPNMMEWWNATQDAHTRMTVTKAGGVWKNGQKTGETFKITAVEVWMLTSADDIARISSYEPGMLCKTPSAASQAVQNATSGSGTSSGTTTGSGGGSANDLLKKGKGFLDKMTKP